MNLQVAFLLIVLAVGATSFSIHGGISKREGVLLNAEKIESSTRRSFLVENGAAAAIVGSMAFIRPESVNAAIGSLPELQDTNVILQGLTVTVADQSQLENMITFLLNSFDFKVLRQVTEGTVTNTWCGFGPEELSIPSDFEIPVSSFGAYGGHASINVSYDTKTSVVNYRTGGDAPGDNIAYLQVGVPTYRISQMVKNGGNVLDAYGLVNVVSPCGLPMRGIVGISPDPIMFVALNCQDVQASKIFYNQLGFVEQEYPFCRPNKGAGQFEPPQPPNSIYLAPSPNSMGVLLLQGNKRKKVTPNPVLQSLNLVYAPSNPEDEPPSDLVDPSGIKISFKSVGMFLAEEKRSRVATAKE